MTETGKENLIRVIRGSREFEAFPGAEEYLINLIRSDLEKDHNQNELETCSKKNNSIEVLKKNTTNVNDISGVFSGCKKIEPINAPQGLTHMFSSCASLECLNK